MAGKVFIGVSGWRYTPWRGHFHPSGLAQWRELEHASRVFPSLELNGSFYSLQRPSSYALWARQTPPGFVFAIKGSRYITHMLKLRNIEAALANFLASGLFELRAPAWSPDAPENARELMRLLGERWTPGAVA